MKNLEPDDDKRHGGFAPPPSSRLAQQPADRPGAPRARRAAGLTAVLQRLWARRRRTWESPYARLWRGRVSAWQTQQYSGAITLLAGTALITLLIAAINRVAVPLPNPGVLYLPLIAMLAYHWSWRHGAVASALQLGCMYLFFILPAVAIKPLTGGAVEQLVTLALVDAFILALVQLARTRRDLAEREAQRFAALNTVGTALAGELNEERLLKLIAQTARDLTGAGFAAFTLRPVDSLGRPIGPAEGNLFHLAAVVGVTPAQEALFRRMPLGGEGLLAPIFRHGVSVRIADALDYLAPKLRPLSATSADHDIDSGTGAKIEKPRDIARERAFAYAHGQLTTTDLSGVGVPRGHPVVRSFLGAPLLDRDGKVRGGLLLGHTQPDRFTLDDEALLEALAAQAAVALENARLYRAAQTQARELDAVFESITDGVSVVDAEGHVRHENRAAGAIRAPASAADTTDGGTPEPSSDLSGEKKVGEAIAQALAGQSVRDVLVSRAEASGERREYVVSASPLLPEQDGKLRTTSRSDADDSARGAESIQSALSAAASGAVVVWHDVTETRKLLAEQQARSQAEAQRTLLQVVIDELPIGVYLVRGRDAQLVLANRAAMGVWGAQWPVGETMTAFLATSGTQIAGAGGQLLASNELATLLALRSGEAVRHHEEIIRRPDGTSLPILFNAVALNPQSLSGLLPPDAPKDARGGQAPAVAEPAALVVLQDVTALKEAEQLKDEFIAVAAHELKTPMAAVKGYADMLLRQSERDEQFRLTEWQSEALETIDQATSRLVELTNDLLDVTRIQAGRMELHPEPHDLVALARRIVKRFQVTTDRHTLSVEVEGDEDYVVACLDVPRTEQVLANLVSNAIKYSPKGGAITISIREEVSRTLAEMRVQDCGIGIPERQQAQLFHRFSRADNARELGIAGTGLGLYLCRELVELQGGRIWFTSAEGQGTTFYVTLPLATE